MGKSLYFQGAIVLLRTLYCRADAACQVTVSDATLRVCTFFSLFHFQ